MLEIVTHFTAPYCTALYCTVLHCTALYCTVLYFNFQYCTSQRPCQAGHKWAARRSTEQCAAPAADHITAVDTPPGAYRTAVKATGEYRTDTSFARIWVPKYLWRYHIHQYDGGYQLGDKPWALTECVCMRERVCVCVWERIRESVCVCVWERFSDLLIKRWGEPIKAA